MSWLNQLFSKLFELFNWFFTVVPWERGVRVRMGKHMKVCQPGIHIQLPFIDKVYLMNIRDRIHATNAQTLTTADGVTITLQAGIRFSIVDVMPMYNRLHQAGDTIGLEIEGLISDYVITHKADECKPAQVLAHVKDHIHLEEYGLDCTKIMLTDFVRTKTYRFIQGGLDRYTEASGMSTDNERKS